jgi:NADH:ubiquinone oxidoreductase subunit H
MSGGAVRTARRSFGWLAGPAAWAGFFLVAYASESLICTHLNEPGWHGAIIVSAACVAVLLIAGRLRLRPEQARSTMGRFRARAGLALGWLSLLAIGWTALVALILPACT